MTYNLEPIERVVDHCRVMLGLSWQEVAEDLNLGHITPAQNQPGKRRIVGQRVEAIVAGESPTVVLYVRQRRAPDLENHTPVVGVEPKRRMPRQKGGAGSQWPTSFEELAKLAERDKRVRVVRGGKHYLVLRDGQQVASLPITTSDWRAVKNACSQMRDLGIDVRRAP